MAALTGLFIADSYKALLKTVDNDVLGAAAKEIVDGYGNVSGVLFDTSGNVTINGNFRALDAILDSSGSAGTAGQVLTTTGSTTQWQSLSSVSGVTGSGTAGYLPLWSTNSALTNSIALQSGSTITISGTLTATTKINTPTLQLTGGVGAQGTFTWNADEETVDLVQNGATLQLGQEVQIHCKNQTGALIPDGTPVYAVGTLGASGRILIAPMIANGSIDAKYFLGITTEDIANGDDGKVTTFGKIRGLNTAAYTEGQTLWVSSTVAGAFQTTRPLAPNLDLEVAIVINSHANNGTIFVRANNGHYLGTAHDVNISSVAENDLLVYKTNRWVNTKSIGDLSAANVTLSGYLRGPEVFVIDPAAHGNNEGLVQILGDLRVDGITTTINSTTISVSDKNITLAKDAVTAGDANGAGITIAGANATLTYESVADRFVFNKNIEVENSNPTLSLYYSGAVNNENSGRIHFVESPTSVAHFEIQYNGATNTLNFNSPIDGTTGLFTINRSGNATASGTITASTFVGDLTGNADTADALSTAVNIALTGSVLGNADFDGSGDIIITTTTNHNHDDIYYTETESDNRFVNVSGDTMTGDLAISNAQPKLRLKETDTANLDKEISLIGGAIYIKNLNDDNTATNNMIVIDNSGNFTASGTLTAVGYNKTNWDAAYNDKINSGYFDSNTGDLVLTQQDNDTLTINFDDRYVIANTQKFNTNTYGVDSGAGTQRYKLLTTSGQTDQFFHITINRAYDYGDNDQTKQQIIYQRRLTNKNLRWRLDGDLTATSQVFIEIYAKANGDDEVWLVCADYARPQVYVEHDGFFWNGLTNADTPTGTLIKTTELTASNKPNWDEQVGLVKTTELYSDTTYLRGSAFVLAPNGSSYDTLVYRDGTNPHVLYAGGGTSTQWNTAYGWGDHAGLYAPISHTHPYLPLAGGTMSGNINWGATNQGLTWAMNTDGAYIKFFNTGDSDTDSRLEYGTSDNGNEYHRFMISGTERMKITATGITATGYNKSNWDTAYSYSQVGHLPLAGGTLTGDLKVGGKIGVGVTPSDWSLSGLSAMQIKNAGFYGYSTNEYGLTGNVYYNGGWKYIANGTAQLYIGVNGSHIWYTYASGTADAAAQPVQTMQLNTAGNLTVTGTLSATGGNSTNWNTAYGWGNHAGLYLPIGGKAADSELLDGIDSSRVVYGSGANKSTAFDNGNINTAMASGFYDGYNMVGAPTASTYYHLIHARHNNTANNFAMQLAGAFYSDTLYYRQITNNVASAWRTIIHSGNIGSQSVNYAAGAGNASTLDTLDSSQFLRSDVSDTMTGSLTVNGSGVGITATSSQNTGLIVDGGTNSGIISEFKFGTTKAVINTSGGGYFLGNVGIGTTAPSEKLSVIGPDSSTYTISWQNANRMKGNLYSDTGGIAIQSGASFNDSAFYMIPNTSLDFRLNGSTRMYVDSSGSVGIGTTSPSSKLHVAGDIRSEGPDGGMVMRNWQAGATYGMIGTANMSSQEYALLTNGTDTLIGGGANGWTYIRSGNNDSNPQLVINGTNSYFDGGNLGVGVSLPQQKLHIRNGTLLLDSDPGYSPGIWMPDLNGNPSLRIVTDQIDASYTSIINAWGAPNSGVTLGTTRNDGVAFQVRSGVTVTSGFATDSGSTRFIVNGDGNVGVGLTNPSEKLTVNGNIDFPFSTSGVAYFGIQPSPNNPYASNAKELVIRGANAYTAGTPTQAQAGGDVYIKGGYAAANIGLGVYAGDVSIEGGEVYGGSTTGAGNVIIKTAGQQRLKVNNLGNVGIGTEPSSFKLDVNGAIQGLGISSNSVSKSYTWRLNNTGNSGNIWRRICRFDSQQSGRIKIEMTGQTGYGSNTAFGSVVTIIGQINNGNNLQGSWWVEGYEAAVQAVQFELIAASQYYINVLVGSYAEYAITATISVGTLTLSDTTVSGSSNVARRRWFRSETSFLDYNVGIGTTSPSEKLDIQDGRLRFTNTASGRNSTIGMDDNYNFYIKNTPLGNLYIGNGTTTFVNGTLQATGVIRSQNDVIAYYSSDKHLKDNITPITNAIDKVKAIGGYEFDWNDKQEVYEGHDVGVIAQEIEAVMPEVVTTRENGYKAVKYEKIVPLLIEAIKEQQKQIDELKSLLDVRTK